MIELEYLELGLYALATILGGSFVLPPKIAKFLGYGFKVAKVVGKLGDQIIESPAGFELKPKTKEEAKKKVYESIGNG